MQSLTIVIYSAVVVGPTICGRRCALKRAAAMVGLARDWVSRAFLSRRNWMRVFVASLLSTGSGPEYVVIEGLSKLVASY